MNQRRVRMLVTSAGRRVGLIECFRSAAASIGIDLEVHSCDLHPELSAACTLSDASFAAPRCDHADYIPRLLDYARAHEITLIVPTIDTELRALAEARDVFADTGTYVHVSTVETIDIVRDKQLTMEVLSQAGVPVPRTATLEGFRSDAGNWQWPLFVKPVAGSASRGIALLHGVDEIRADYPEPMLVQEALSGDEYTVNLLVDEHGIMRGAIPHLRISVRAGEVEKGRTVRRPDLEEISRSLVKALPGARGVICFQLFDDPVLGPRVFEINARFGGGYPLADRAGGRFAENVLRSALGLPAFDCDTWQEGLTMLRYDSAVFF